LGLTTWSPLAAGLLTGKYLDGIPEDSRAELPAFVCLRALDVLAQLDDDVLSRLDQAVA
jgi:aryl-alcohol dehydrogenase-like predicted oxidoreductase